MKKVVIIAAVLIAVVAVLGVAGFAYAQTRISQQGGFGPGMMGGWGMMGRGARQAGYGPGMMANGNYGPMHQYMIDALAEGLGLSSADLQASVDAGQTPYQVAQSKGLSSDQITKLFTDAHDKALAKAVEAGAITQQQADWMDQHMESMWGNGFGPGNMPCHNWGGTNQ